ncbi:MAG TPA: hypothetical protein VE684_13225 [Crenalkalicoccus sp.]|jgi:hypothetical protein|nr:hypothetical protein [Crenalkalicoccus sp.]
MRRRSALLLLPALAGSDGRAETPAERASRTLNRDTAADRFDDRARDAHGDPRPPIPGVQQFDEQRRSYQPDVGRSEAGNATGPAGGRPPSGGPNPQR